MVACSIDHTEGPMSERQAEALRVATRTLDDLADLVEEGLPTLDQSGYDRVIRTSRRPTPSSLGGGPTSKRALTPILNTLGATSHSTR